MSQFDSGWHVILVGHLDFVQLTCLFFRFSRFGVSLLTIRKHSFANLLFSTSFLVRKIDILDILFINDEDYQKYIKDGCRMG